MTNAVELGQMGLVVAWPLSHTGVSWALFPELWTKGRPRTILGQCSGASPPTTADGTEPCAGKEIFPKSVREGRSLSTSCLDSVSLCHFCCDRCRKSFSAFMFPCPFLGEVMKIVLFRFDKGCFQAALLSWERESGVCGTEQLYGSFWSMCLMDLEWEHV